MSSEVARIEPGGGGDVVTTTTGQDPTGGRLVAWADGLAAAHRIGSALCQTSFVPKHFQGHPEEAAAAILFGDEIGFTPTQALRSIYVVGGSPALYARAMVALVLSHGHEVWTEKDTPDEVVVCGKRRGSSRVEKVTWTTARARKAGYTSNKKYESDPQAMLYARASGDVARRVAPDVLAGVAYTVEEMWLSEAPASSTRRTVRRSQPAPEAREPELEPAKPAPEQQTAEPDPQPEPEVEPDPITRDQSKRMHATFNDAGITARGERLAYATRVLGREVSSSKDLTKHEATLVIDALNEQLRGESSDASDAPQQQESEPGFDGGGDPWQQK